MTTYVSLVLDPNLGPVVLGADNGNAWHVAVGRIAAELESRDEDEEARLVRGFGMPEPVTTTRHAKLAELDDGTEYWVALL